MERGRTVYLVSAAASPDEARAEGEENSISCVQLRVCLCVCLTLSGSLLSYLLCDDIR